MFRLGSHSSHIHQSRRTGRDANRRALGAAVAVGTAGTLAFGLLAPAGAAGEGEARSATSDPATPVRDVDLSGPAKGVRAAEVSIGTPARATRSAQEAGTVTMRTDGVSMVGATWTGERPRGLRVRTARHGGWGPWQALHDLTDGPDASSGEAGRGLGATDLLWVGRATKVQVSTAGAVPRGTRLVLMDTTGVRGTPERRDVAATAPLATAAKERPRRHAPRPYLRARKKWGANERWRDGEPVHGRTIRQVHLHHTVNSNSYSRSDVAGMIRGMYRYHTKSLGWSDIGYNVLVDRFGRAWVGRYGGVARRVQGAHTLGFNHDATGIAVIGNYENADMTRPVRRRIIEISAWLLDMDRRSALGRTPRFSKGSDKYRAGRKVMLPVIDGHRDTNDTACPGDGVYEELPRIRRWAQHRIDKY